MCDAILFGEICEGPLRVLGEIGRGWIRGRSYYTRLTFLVCAVVGVLSVKLNFGFGFFLIAIAKIGKLKDETREGARLCGMYLGTASTECGNADVMLYEQRIRNDRRNLMFASGFPKSKHSDLLCRYQ